MEPILLAIALMFVPALHAQITVQSGPIYQASWADGIPDVIPMRPSCPDGFKTQRYHRGITATFTQGPATIGGVTTGQETFTATTVDLSGWEDVDATKPQDGDYQCVRVKGHR
ncbi:MAG TPA: hypothetical protein VMQ60_01615 [Acidobacteriaceae bacterium]|jgi:hypothetical protein|nr:hypothetical protein [Acidobacteriaceae bacterium]